MQVTLIKLPQSKTNADFFPFCFRIISFEAIALKCIYMTNGALCETCLPDMVFDPLLVSAIYSII